MGKQLSRHAVPEPAPCEAGRFDCLVFLLGAEAFGLDIARVCEIRGYEGVLPVAGAPPCLKGVIHVGASLAPVVDLRVRFGLGEARYDHVVDILVVDTGRGMGGILVDNLCEMVRIEPGAIGPAPHATGAAPHPFLAGTTLRDGHLVGLVDLAKVFAGVHMNPQACQVA